ncbi:peptide chain release factor N(5)-glutamine methyltransferase [Aerosakkonemataceae cyanobacterium BLCC-F154]|uniref:Release factor glutamine methyltransferase n=1 Tax=Floridaenema fluviatile BLCC-F154 TaxID=3153640 RepID=A0ABV4Y5I1_9CYAN
MLEGKVVSGLELWQWRIAAIKGAKLADVSPMEVDWILQEVAGLDTLSLRLELFKDRSQIPLTIPISQLNELWQKRLEERLPVQYITGITPWRNFNLVVSPAVLIPRPETELLIDLAVEAVQGYRGVGVEENSLTPNSKLQTSPTHWVDLGTGSGAIAVGLADAFSHAIIHAVDRSVEALNIAQENAQRLGFSPRINFYQGSWFAPLQKLKGKLTGMVSNPPYIPSSIVLTLQPEVANHEPHLALDGGDDGLDCIRLLVKEAPDYLVPGGIWLIETMAGQTEAVVELLNNQGSYCNIQIFADLSGIDRFVLAYHSK